MKSVTIQDVANEAQVSIATVSRVISGKGQVSTERRNRVLESAERLGYTTDQKVRTPRKVEARVLLMIVPRISNPFYAEIVHGFQNTAYRNGYEVMLCQSMSNPRRLEEYIELMRSGVAEGAVTLDPMSGLDVFAPLVGDFPIVQCSEYNEALTSSYVTVDNVRAAREVVLFLHSIGCRRIALINSGLNFKYARDRQQGFEEGMKELGLPVRPEWVAHVADVNFNLALGVAERLLGVPNPPDGIFAVSDVFAAAVEKAAKRMGLRVPQDLAVVGFDNIDVSLMCDPSITTVNQPRYEMGAFACDMLLERIRNPGTPIRHLVLNTELIVRESTLR
jgi:LacI family transcriptional regulator, repressor for deo operon, udp, cdd, tsx, nupC, and nupG